MIFTCPLVGKAQRFPELFKTFENNLTYSDSIITQLRTHSDSLNTTYNKLNTPNYTAKPQARGHYIRLKKNVNLALKDMQNNISFVQFLKKHTPETVHKDLLITKSLKRDNNGDTIVTFSSLELGPIENHWLTFDNRPKLYYITVKNTWVIEHWPKGEYNDEYIDAYYFEEEFESKILPSEHSERIFYSEVVIGSNQPLFSKKAREIRNSIGGLYFVDPHKVEDEPFLIYVNKITKKPKLRTISSSEQYQKRIEKWKNQRTIILDSLKDDPYFRAMLDTAYIDNLSNDEPNRELNFYFNRYLSNEKLLAYYRSYYYIGGGSTDGSPRTHIYNISNRAALEGNWEVFIKGHLNLLFDKVERSSDLSLMDENRNTYVKELTAIKLDIDRLLFGTIYEIGNGTELQYNGNVRRLGRTLAELDSNAIYKDKILSVIKDKNLDIYNRLLYYYLFINYNYYLENKKEQKLNEKELETVLTTFPSYISSKLLDK